MLKVFWGSALAPAEEEGKMMIPLVALVSGLVLLVWSADRFVEGSTVTADYLRMPPILIGMIIVGFGTLATSPSG